MILKPPCVAGLLSEMASCGPNGPKMTNASPFCVRAGLTLDVLVIGAPTMASPIPSPLTSPAAATDVPASPPLTLPYMVVPSTVSAALATPQGTKAADSTANQSGEMRIAGIRPALG